MRPHGKNIEKVPDMEEVRFSIDERDDLMAAEKVSRAIQQILDI